ncbi:PPC domain-containing protein [Mycoplasmatota bacterium]|nr:PPC domain-containing protein [Mycoplasmatota bacterium]
MKKNLLVLFFFMATFLLTSCEEVLKAKELSDETISEQIDAVINAKSYEAKIHFRIKTDEMELSVNPLLSLQKYTDDHEKEVYRVHYYNKLMEANGLEAFEFIIDERDEAVYINNSNAWFKSTFDEIEDEANLPIFAYLFDIDSEEIDDEIQTDIENIQDIIFTGMKNFNEATYIDVIKEDERQLIHYELEYNVYNILEEVFDYFNEKDEELEYNKFSEFLDEIGIQDVIDIFNEFTIDVYFDSEDNSIGRIELDLVNILDNDIILDKLEEEIDNEDINIHTAFDYLNDFEIGINLYEINSLDEITVPDEAKTGYSLHFLGADFNPEDLIDINVGDTIQGNFDDTDEIWYTFTIEDTQTLIISLTNDENDAYSTLYDSEFDHLSYLAYSNDVKTYENLPDGTYYLKIVCSSGNVELTIE